MIYGSNVLRAPRCCVGLTRAARVAVTARCPCRRSGPSAILHARVRAPGARLTWSPRAHFPCRAAPPAIRGCATPSRFKADLCRCITEHFCSFAFDRRASRRHAIAMQRLDLLISSIAPLSHDAPSRDIAFQSRRPANLGGAMPSPFHASLCLRQALLIKATPSQPESFHRRCMPRLCFAITEQCVTLPSPLVA